MIADMPHPARCPGCGAGVELTLVADPNTPVYACGSTPFRIVCVQSTIADRMRAHPEPLDLPNVRVITPAERVELRTLFLRMAPEVNAPRLALCTTPGCDKVAINGTCISD